MDVVVTGHPGEVGSGPSVAVPGGHEVASAVAEEEVLVAASAVLAVAVASAVEGPVDHGNIRFFPYEKFDRTYGDWRSYRELSNAYHATYHIYAGSAIDDVLVCARTGAKSNTSTLGHSGT